jgi:RHS repeat-associated protein
LTNRRRGNRIARFVDSNNDNQWSTGEAGQEYTWDHRNRLVATIDYDCNGTPNNYSDDTETKRVDYIYDAFNQLIKRTVDGDGNLATTTDVDQKFFLYDMGQVALEFHKEGSDNVTAGDLEHRYLWNPAAVDQLLADEQVNSLSNAAANDTLWALTDHLGSVRDLVDDAGVLQNHKSYDSFGNVIAETNASADTAFGYTGRYLDEATGLQNNLHRWYDASVGRWISEDPIGFAAGDANLYRYVGNMPGIYVDPSGLDRDIMVGGPIGIHHWIRTKDNFGFVCDLHFSIAGYSVDYFAANPGVSIEHIESTPAQDQALIDEYKRRANAGWWRYYIPLLNDCRHAAYRDGRANSMGSIFTRPGRDPRSQGIPVY